MRLIDFKNPDISLISRLFFVETLTVEQIYQHLLGVESYNLTNLNDVAFSLLFIKNLVLEIQDFLFDELFYNSGE